MSETNQHSKDDLVATRIQANRPVAPWPRRLALGVACLAIAGTLALAGITAISARAEGRDRPEPAKPLPVHAVEVRQQPGYPLEHAYAARVEPARRSELAFETGGTVIEVRVDEGERVVAGDVLARLDTQLLEAHRDQLAAARTGLDADADLARLTLSRQQSLDQRGFGVGEALDEARLSVVRIRAGIAEADAALALAEAELDLAVLRAPFDAVVSHRALDEGTAVSASTTVLELLEDAPPHFRVGLPPARAARLDRQATYRFFPVAGHSASMGAIPARLLSVRDDIDIRTRTVSARFEPLGVATNDKRSRPPTLLGELLELRLEAFVERPVYEVPMAALVEAERGLWSVLALAVERPEALSHARPRRIPVRIVRLADDHAYVEAELGERAWLVADGRHRVVPGERVRVVLRTSFTPKSAGS